MSLFSPFPHSFDLPDRSLDSSAVTGAMEHFFMSTRSPLAILGLDGCLKQVNAAFRNLFAGSASAIDQSWLEFVHPDDRATVQTQWQSMVQSGSGQSESGQREFSGRIEARMLSPQGDDRWFAWQLDFVDDRQRVYAVGQDISEYRRREAELRQREERWLLALRGSNDGVWDWNVETNEVYFSPRWKSMLGFEDHEVANDLNEWAERVHPDDLEWVTGVIQDHFARKIPFYITEHRVLCKDGSYKWILDRGQAIWDAAGRTIRMVGSHTDIDERKALEAALQQANHQLEQRVAERTAQLEQANAALTEREALYRTLAQHIPNGSVLLFDRDLRYLLVEGDELKRVGLDRNQIIGKTLWEVFPPEMSGAIEPHYRAALTGQSLMYELPFQQQIYEAHTVPVRNDQGEIFAGMVLTQNITDRSRSETLLATQNYILEMITTGAFLSEILETLAHLIESQSDEAICSILLLNEADNQLHLAACPSLPQNFSCILEKGVPVNPIDTICGTAAYTRQTVIVPDIDAEFRWAKSAALLRQHNLKACWSTPVLDSQGKVLGTFALYYRTSRLPNTAEQRLITIASHLAGVAIERQRSGAALKQREDQLRLITETIPQQVWTATPDGQVDYYNQRWCEFTGKTVEQLKNEGWAEIVHPDDLEQVGQRWAASIQSGSEYQAEARLRAANGEYRWILGQARPLRNAQGQIVKWYGTNTDITEQKQAETALQESEQRLQAILNQSEAVIYLKDSQGRYLLVNHQYELLSQRTQTALQAKAKIAENPTGDLRRPSPETVDLFCSPDLEVLETGQPLTYEERLYLPDSVRTYLSVKFPLLNADGIPYAVCSISTDITDRKQIELERERYAEQSYRLLQQEQTARAQAEQANRIKDEFLAVLSHELRTPLNPILGWSKLLQSRQLSPERVQQGLETIERNVKLQTQLIDDLLDISRILRGKLVLDMASVDLAEPIAAALETVRLSAEAKGVHLSTQMDASLRRIYGDASRLQQVMWNLLSNAIKFTSAGGTVRVKVEQVGGEMGSGRVGGWESGRVDEQGSRGAGEQGSRGAENAVSSTFSLPHCLTHLPTHPSTHPPIHPLTCSIPFIKIQVIDTGKGIAPEFLPYVFEHFRQQDSSTTRQFGGLGLGLAIAKQLVEAHGGTVTVESAGEGQGATFSVFLPLMLSAEPEANPEAEGQPIRSLRGLRVLLVDDDVDTLTSIAYSLEQQQFHVTSVESAAAAIVVLEQSSFDLLISDIGMPEMDGYQLMHSIRARPTDRGGNLPAIALTAYASSSDQQRAIASGFQMHLAKPIAMETLLQSIGKLLNQEGSFVVRSGD